MDRKTFLRNCGYVALGIPFAMPLLQSCGGIHYAAATHEKDRWVVAKSEFVRNPKNPLRLRQFVMIQPGAATYPICLYRTGTDAYVATEMKCTHRHCELDVGGGIYICPCHGSEFSTEGKVLNGPAERDLRRFKTQIDHDHIYIFFDA